MTKLNDRLITVTAEIMSRVPSYERQRCRVSRLDEEMNQFRNHFHSVRHSRFPFSFSILIAPSDLIALTSSKADCEHVLLTRPSRRSGIYQKVPRSAFLRTQLPLSNSHLKAEIISRVPDCSIQLVLSRIGCKNEADRVIVNISLGYSIHRAISDQLWYQDPHDFVEMDQTWMLSQTFSKLIFTHAFVRTFPRFFSVSRETTSASGRERGGWGWVGNSTANRIKANVTIHALGIIISTAIQTTFLCLPWPIIVGSLQRDPTLSHATPTPTVYSSPPIASEVQARLEMAISQRSSNSIFNRTSSPRSLKLDWNKKKIT